ncbi:MAG: hypothetical protein PUB42_00335 [Firmicutes bacterium]|nr:hypothetical protein [Bacillota bacterium]
MKIIFTIIYITVIGQACFWGGMLLPREIFCEDKFPYAPFKWEKNGKFYAKFNVKQWKSKVPDMSKVSDLLFPKRIVNTSPEGLDRLVKESCVAEFVHYILCVLSFGIYMIWKNRIGVILTALYIVLGNLPYVMIQRYNRPNYISLRNRLMLREERKINV